MYNQVLNHPVDLTKSIITQEFGANPNIYKQYIVHGKPLAGHNGMDYGSYGQAEIPIWPVDDGVVEFVGYKPGPNVKNGGYDPDGWGNYIDVRHSWGKSRYAHFSKIYVKVGDRVIAPKNREATHLGDMGTTGNSTGVHLHLGIYPTGEPVINGYGGAINPRPYFTRNFYGTPILVKPVPVPGIPPTPPNPANPPSTTVFPPPLNAGQAMVVYQYGLPLRLGSSTQGVVITKLAFGTKINIGGEYKDIGNTRWRKVELWIGEWQNGEQLIKQA